MQSSLVRLLASPYEGSNNNRLQGNIEIPDPAPRALTPNQLSQVIQNVLDEIDGADFDDWDIHSASSNSSSQSD